MLSHLKEAFFWTLKLFARTGSTIGFIFSALWDWLKGFSAVASASSFLVPKLLLVLVGKIFTPFPIWLLVFLSFAPPGPVYVVFFVAFIAVLKQ